MKTGDKVRLVVCPENLRGGVYRIAGILSSDFLIIETPYGPRHERASNCILVSVKTNLKNIRGFGYV